MFRYAALRSCSSITRACSSSWEAQQGRGSGPDPPPVETSTPAGHTVHASTASALLCSPLAPLPKTPGRRGSALRFSHPVQTPSTPERDVGSTSTARHAPGAGRAPSPAHSQRGAQGSQCRPVHHTADPASSPGPSAGCQVPALLWQPRAPRKAHGHPLLHYQKVLVGSPRLWDAALVPPTSKDSPALDLQLALNRRARNLFFISR